MPSSITSPNDRFDDIPMEPVSIRRLLRTLAAYRRVIILSLAATAVAYTLLALISFLLSPTERVTSQPFRLDFEGAASGKFPNGLRFSTADLISPNILLDIYRRNELARYGSFANFGRSIFVLESNRAYERLAADYQARLADPKLSPVDRDRVQAEFDQKREAIAKNEYSLNYVRLDGLQRIPDPTVKKVLSDVLSTWAQYAMRDQDVLAYRIAVLSPEILEPTEAEKSDPVIATQMLRNRTVRLLDNLSQLQKLPGAELVRSASSRMSLEEVRLRMEEVQRYRIEPLVSRVAGSGSASAVTLQFLQDQLDYDNRKLAAAHKQADSLRDTLAVYEQSAPTAAPAQTVAAVPESKVNVPGGRETVMPQISDSFIDRMIALAGKSSDAEYRQKIVDDYRHASEAVIPLEQAVSYDTALLAKVKSGGVQPGDPANITGQIEASRAELRLLATRMNEIYREISKNVYSTSQLITLTAPPSTRVTRAVDIRRLVLWGLVVMLLALPLTLFGALLHNRVREEEAEEEHLIHEATALSASAADVPRRT